MIINFLVLILSAQLGEQGCSPIEYLTMVLEDHDIYEEPFPEGYMFILEEEDSTTCRGSFVHYFDIAIREDHVASGEGDPNTAPIVDRFRVYGDGRIVWYSPIPGMYIPWEDFLQGKTEL